jgi:putative copper resistance protein D
MPVGLLRRSLFWAHYALVLLLVLLTQGAARPVAPLSPDKLSTVASVGDASRPSAPQESDALAEQRESEANHHLAGGLVLLAGLFLIGSRRAQRRWPWLRFAWPACFVACGLFLLVYSDSDLWPFGPQSWWYGLSHDPEDLQHKLFAMILLTLGVVEVQRVRGVLTTPWSAWVFPVLALLGALMLPFHEHMAGMSTMDHMADMRRIQVEHIAFAVTGGAIAITKGLSELHSRWRLLFLRTWPLGLVLLGVQLLTYVES